MQTAKHLMPSLLLEWFGFLAPPIAWTMQFAAIYALAGYFPYGSAAGAMHAAAALCFVVSIAGGMVAWRNLLTARAAADAGMPNLEAARARTMGILGLMTSALFSVVIIAQWMAVLFLEPSPVWK